MPLWDRTLKPALERVMPADIVDNGTWRNAHHEPVTVIFGDGQWHDADLLDTRTDRHGREVLHLEWYTAGSTWSEHYLYEAGKVRRWEEEG